MVTNKQTTTQQQNKQDRPFTCSDKNQVEAQQKKLIQVSGRTKLVLDSQRARP